MNDLIFLVKETTNSIIMLLNIFFYITSFVSSLLVIVCV